MFHEFNVILSQWQKSDQPCIHIHITINFTISVKQKLTYRKNVQGHMDREPQMRKIKQYMRSSHTVSDDKGCQAAPYPHSFGVVCFLPPALQGTLSAFQMDGLFSEQFKSTAEAFQISIEMISVLFHISKDM